MRRHSPCKALDNEEAPTSVGNDSSHFAFSPGLVGIKASASNDQWLWGAKNGSGEETVVGSQNSNFDPHVVLPEVHLQPFGTNRHWRSWCTRSAHTCEVAIKNSLDVFYFNVAFELPVVLVEGGALGREQFAEIWQRVGEAREHTMAVSTDRSLSIDAARSRLALDNVHYVAQRQVDDGTTLVYASATTTNNCVILTSLTLSSANASISIATRTETPVLIPLFEAAVSKRLGMR